MANEKPELEAEVAAALGEDDQSGGNPEGTPVEIQITNENALIIMAQALIGIEKHLLALVYLENTKDPARSGVTYIPSVFNAIYDGSDPFAEVDEMVKTLKANEAAGKEVPANGT